MSGYWYKADHLITLTATDDPDAFLGVTYVNEGEVRAKGLEFEAQMRLWRGAEGHMSYALQEAIDQATGETLHQLSSSDGQGARERSALRQRVVARGGSPRDRQPSDAERQLDRSRSDGKRDGDQAAGTNARLFGTVRNLFDVDYAVPASSEHVQDTIPQNGRTFRVGLRVKLPL